MALIVFPSNPVNGEEYPLSPPVGTNIYQWEAATATWRIIGTATGVTAGCYGDGGNVSTFCVDSAGRVTNAGTTPISGFVKLNNPAASNAYIWPNSDGRTNTFLTTDGTGKLSWKFPPNDLPAGLGLTDADNCLRVKIPVESVPPVEGTAEQEAVVGSLYWDDNLGQLFIYYDDGITKQWVSTSPPQPPPPGGTVTSITAGTGLTGGTITVAGTIALREATVTTLGGVKVDGSTILVTPDGTISTPPPLWEDDGTYLTPTGVAQSVAVQDAGGNEVVRLISSGEVYASNYTSNLGTPEEWRTAPTRGILKDVLTSAGDGTTYWDTPIPKRISLPTLTNFLAPGVSDFFTVPGFKSYLLQKITVDAPAWVVIYMDQVSMLADNARQPGTPAPYNSGVIAEADLPGTGGNLGFYNRWFTPGVVGWNNTPAPTTDIYVRVQNTSPTTSRNINVTLQIVQMES